MKIAYVFMDYPAPSEIFGTVEIEGLERKGICVYKYSILSNHKKCSRDVIYTGIVRQFFSFLRFFISPKKFLSFISLSKYVSLSKKEFLKLIFITFKLESIAKDIKDKNVDVAHLFWGHYPSGLIYWLKNDSTIPVSIFTGAYDLESNLGIMKWGVNNADVVFTHSEYNVEKIRSFYSGHVNVIYRGIEVKSPEPVLKKLSHCIKFVFVGRLKKTKRPDLAIKTFNTIVKRHSNKNMSLDIFGQGEELNNLKLLVKDLRLEDNVIFHGHVPHKKMFETISDSNFLLFPSQHPSERLPNSVKECMNLGCIPITSFTPGIDELVLHGTNGFIVDFTSEEEILNIVRMLLDDPVTYKNLIKNAKSKVLEDFSVDNLTSKKLEIYQRTLFK